MELLSRITKNTHTNALVFIACVFFVACVFFLPNTARAEYIESFIVDIAVGEDSSFKVTEQIAYVFTAEKHGIFRCIPTIHEEKPSSIFKERYIDISDVSVHMDSASVPYEVTENSSEICIKIGDPNTVIDGEHTYTIEYVVHGGISYEAFGGAELYWNVTGNEWEVGMEYVETKVSSKDSILLRERACYRGEIGKSASCEMRVSGEEIFFSTRILKPGEGLTIAQALDRSKIAYDVRERHKSFLIWIISILGMLSVSGLLLYRYKTKFKTDAPIIPQYEPYPDVKPMYAGLLFDKRLDPRDITAGIVYLAKEGFIQIKKIDTKVLFFFEVDDYEMTLLRPAVELTGFFEQHLLTLIFKEHAAAGKKVTLRELKDDYATTRTNTVLLRALETELKEDLKMRGFYMGFNFSSVFNKQMIAIILVCGGVLVYFSGLLASIGAVIIIVVLIVLGEGRRTEKGYEALDHLKGFKDFLRVTETQRYIFHNAPEKNAEQFMEYLPYAIAFGVEKEWAKTFEGITIPNPEWYDSGSNVHTFNAVSLTQSLGGFSTAFAQSSGSSASSGGGHSGGGSGGGGGGSW